MKIVWSAAVVALTVALVSATEEEKINPLQEVEGRCGGGVCGGGSHDTASSGSTITIPKPVLDTTALDFNGLLLKLGDFFMGGHAIGDIDYLDHDFLKPNITCHGGSCDLGALAGLAGLGALPALGAGGLGWGAYGLASVLNGLASFKSGLLGLLVRPLDIANFILAVIALALLIAYLVETEGDIDGLITGTGYASSGSGSYRREDAYNYDSYSSYVSQARALFNEPIVQRLTNFVYDAIAKYEE